MGRPPWAGDSGYAENGASPSGGSSAAARRRTGEAKRSAARPPRRITTALITAVLARRHPQQAYRSCIGLQRLAKRYGDARLEAAAACAGMAKALTG